MNDIEEIKLADKKREEENRKRLEKEWKIILERERSREIKEIIEKLKSAYYNIHEKYYWFDGEGKYYKYKKDKEAVMLILKETWRVLLWADKSFRDDKDVIMAAIQENIGLIEFASDRLKNDKDVMMLAVEDGDGSNLIYASKKLKNDKDIVKLAIRSCPEMLKEASYELRADKDIIMEIAKSPCDYSEKIEALKYTSERLRNDKEVKDTINKKEKQKQKELEELKKEQKKIQTIGCIIIIALLIITILFVITLITHPIFILIIILIALLIGLGFTIIQEIKKH